MPSLTKAYVDRLEPQKEDSLYWDDKLAGFGLKVTPAGRKVYLLKYRTKDGRQRKPTIGVHGSITCEQARKIALEWLADTSKGQDPSQLRKTLRQSPSVTILCDKYLEEHSRVHKKEKSTALEDFYIRKYIKPQLGSLKTVSVTKSDISKFHIGLKSTPTQANRILQTLSKMFNLAETWGIRPPNSNPVKGIKKYKEEARERFLSTEEIKNLVSELGKLEATDRKSIYFVSLVRLLMMTGARLSEIQFSKWEWVDFKNGLLYLPDSKTGKKIIQLSPASIKILQQIPRVINNPYIIAGSIKGMPLHNAQKPWRRLRKAADLEGLRLHDLRHTFASLCVAQGYSLQMVSKLLGHADTRMSERYAHLTKTSIQDAAADIGNIIEQAERKARVLNNGK